MFAAVDGVHGERGDLGQRALHPLLGEEKARDLGEGLRDTGVLIVAVHYMKVTSKRRGAGCAAAPTLRAEILPHGCPRSWRNVPSDLSASLPGGDVLPPGGG